MSSHSTSLKQGKMAPAASSNRSQPDTPPSSPTHQPAGPFITFEFTQRLMILLKVAVGWQKKPDPAKFPQSAESEAAEKSNHMFGTQRTAWRDCSGGCDTVNSQESMFMTALSPLCSDSNSSIKDNKAVLLEEASQAVTVPTRSLPISIHTFVFISSSLAIRRPSNVTFAICIGARSMGVR